MSKEQIAEARQVDLLTYGSYEIIEKTPPTGYLNTGIIRQSFQIREEGVIVDLKASETVIKNNIIRGGVRVEKWDNEIDAHRPQGGATLEGAIFEIVNRSADSVLVQDVLYEVGEVVYTFETDSTGTAQTPSELLPYGTYEVREVSPPRGYLATGVLNRTFEIREHGVTVVLNTSDKAIKNNPIRGDLKGVKISDGDAKRLANVPFAITSVTTGESHVIVTDINGEFSTASSWNPHSQNTNRGETDRDGIWFGQPETLNDELGALLYDTYLIEELPCEANKGYELLSFEVSVYRHNTVIDLGTLTNDHIVVPEIFTTARDQDTGDGNAYASEKTTIIDTVYYSGLKAGQEYTVRGILMDKETGEPLLVGGETVTAEVIFHAPADTGSIPMAFTFDSSALKGKAVVVFETLYLEEKEIATHVDIEDEGQTVTFIDPKIGTSAKTENGSKTIPIAESVTVVDAVSYEGLVPGQKYVLKGVLMDKQSGQPLTKDGKAVTAETTFTPTASSGTVEVRFTFDSRAIAGRTLVVFESLEIDGVEIAVHADINDAAQAVNVDKRVPDEPKTPQPTPPAPTQPTKPVPQTSDDNMVIVWIAMLGIALLGGTISFAVYMHLRKKKGKRRMVAAVSLALCVALIAASGYMLAQEARQYTEGANAYDKLAEFVGSPQPQDGADAQDGRDSDGQVNVSMQTDGAAPAAPSRLPVVDFDTLLETNPDIRAWLVCEDTGINYPVAQAEDNSYYLKRLYDGTRNKAGCLFIDYENDPFTDRNTIIYGHNLLDGSMFSELIGYQEQAYFDAHPDLLMATSDGGYIVEVFAAFVASPGEAGGSTSPWLISWEDDAAYSAWLESMQSRALVQTNVSVNTSDQILTLSTCINNGRDRFLVMGKLVPAQ